MSWRKTLRRMSDDDDPRSYTYDDAAHVLHGLGFTLAKEKPKGSHRVWRLSCPGSNVQRSMIVGLVKTGHGTMKPVYVRQMISILRTAGLIPPEQEDDDSLDK